MLCGLCGSLVVGVAGGGGGGVVGRLWVCFVVGGALSLLCCVDLNLFWYILLSVSMSGES